MDHYRQDLCLTTLIMTDSSSRQCHEGATFLSVNTTYSQEFARERVWAHVCARNVPCPGGSGERAAEAEVVEAAGMPRAKAEGRAAPSSQLLLNPLP